ncbi:DNA-binding transcriptional LysR family regulator [Pseudomonas sp. PvR086]|jgi:DNA-binding transcriptional LysR family regulator|uniref:LysR substrate-binding domain-containing protein n=1 Tax=Pseudomonas TaxID=286 RepID=UPI000B35BC1C|nr:MULTISPECIES: LysR substrate-binding domain-containing protein [Pseudomonas]MBD9609169.1 LysR family transcriptional regulator [Pseudomonas sp. PDM08]MDR7108714.1 DNA-binding transcriptional LysR family regulator [Pseudomonas frederiksbergensis]PMY51013.1 LysR family transcriptional regulator [Pseudomonas sp. FW305-53]PMY83778.1 LysR family transcriptional regulator [Pseudomonas sp. FW303-C2]PMY92061.1 LysR family transcriptional regulator [Pseudomonas sp. FW305-62]
MFDALLLKTFVTVVDEEGFSRAAEKLHLTQSAVSGHVRRLEEQIGKPLLRRTTRSQRLTPDGERLVAYARTILALNRDAWAELTRTPFHGRLRIGVSEDFVESRLMRTFQDFAAQYPGMEIDVQVGIPGTLLALMKQGHLELVIGSLCETSDTGLLLWQEPLVWAWSAQPVTELPTPLPLALFPEPCPYREVALTQLARAGIAQRTAMLCSSTAGLRAAALAGFAVAPMPVSQLGQGLAVLGAEQGLPDLPDAQFRLFSAPEADQAIVAAVTQLIVEYCSTRRT